MLRFSASPTDNMQIGSLRVALFNYIVSQQKKEDFIVRIEDSDKNILDILNLFGIKYSQLIYQNEQARFHSAMAIQLIHNKRAFSCFCSDEWLDKKRQEAKENNEIYKYDDACRNLPDELVIDNTAPFCIRINRPNTSDDIDSFIILRQNKTPMQNFATAVDDMLNDISMVISDEENSSNFLKQEYIRTQLNYEKKIDFIALPPMLDDDKTTVKSLLEEGFLPEAIINYLISIGDDISADIFSMNDAIEWLDLSKLSSSPTSFNKERLRDINRKHLQNLDSKELSRYVGFADESIGALAKLYLQEDSTTKELRARIEPIFSPKIIPNKWSEQVLLLTKIIKEAPYFAEYLEFENHLAKESSLQGENLLKPICLLLTGDENTQNISEIYKHIKNYIGEIVK